MAFHLNKLLLVAQCAIVKKSCSALVFAAALFTMALPVTHAAARRTDRPARNSANYVRLNDWARAKGFSVRWLTRDRTLELSSGSARAVFNLESRSDTRKAEINGVQVWLAFPLLAQNGSVYISQTDLSATIGPIFSPPVNPPGTKIKTICLDPGHGGKDPGNRVGSNQEKKYTLLLAEEISAQLKAAGLNVILTRKWDSFVDLPTRPELARKRGADLFVSLHFNSTEEARSQVQGSEVYCLSPAGTFSTNARGEGDTQSVPGNRNDEKNLLLAYQVQKSISRTLGAEDRGVKRARFAVLRDTAMPAILVEAGFMSHPVEGRKIFDPAYRKQMARAIVEGILNYKAAVKG
jgi:N-acetylmuramoyl-L-alanine amidase